MGDDPFTLSGRNSRSGRDGLSDYISGERFGNSAPSQNGRHAHSRGTYGEEYGWSRQGRVRLQPSLFFHDPEAPPPRFLEERSDRKPDMQALMAQYNMDPDQTTLPGDNRSGASPYYLEGPRAPSLQYGLDMLFHHGDTRSQEPHFGGAQGLLGFDTEYSTPSLGSVSDDNPSHFDRLGRPYHYRPPYIESDVNSELGRGQDDRGSLQSMMSPTSFSSVFSPWRGLLTDAGRTHGTP